MNGKVVKVGLVLLVLMAVCLFTVPAFSNPVSTGEHPWGSDRSGDTPTNPGSTGNQDSVAIVPVGSSDSSTTNGAPATGGVVQVIMSVVSTVSILL